TAVDIISGGTPSKAHSDYWNGSIPWGSPKDMKVVYLDDTLDHVSDLALKETTLKLIPEGSILIVVRGMILAHTVPVSINEAPVTINQDMKALVPSERLKSDYLLWTLKAAHGYLLSRVSTAAHGTKRMEVEVLADFQIPLPHPDLQDE